MPEYSVSLNMDNELVIFKTESGVTSMFFANESNSDYQQYLVDTNGGLPLPKETK